MLDATTIIAISTGVAGLIVSVGSVVYQRRQTQIMEASLARDLEAPESDTGTGIESKLRAVINRRLRENRSTMRQEFAPKFDAIERMLQERHVIEVGEKIDNLIRLLNDQKDIRDLADEARRIQDNIEMVQQSVMTEAGRYTADLASHGHEIGALQQELEGLRASVVYLDTLRNQARAIGQQLLQMSMSSEQG